MAHAVEHSELTGRQARVGSFDDQRRSTWDKLGEAIAARDEQAALELAEFALDGECRFIFELLIGWADELRRLLGERGVPEQELRAHTERLALLLAFPDGKPYDPGRRLGGGGRGGGCGHGARSLRRLGRRRIGGGAGLRGLAQAPRPGDRLQLRLDEHLARALRRGERPGDVRAGHDGALRGVLRARRPRAPRLDRGRLRRGRPRHARGHARPPLDGPPRRRPDRDGRARGPLRVRVRPLRLRRPRAPRRHRRGHPSRTQSPYGFGVIEGAYDWTDGKSGMCVYCNHCQQLYEQWTIDRSASPSSSSTHRPPPTA